MQKFKEPLENKNFTNALFTTHNVIIGYYQSVATTKTKSRGVLRKAALKNVLKFTENQLCKNVFLSKVTLLQHTTF